MSPTLVCKSDVPLSPLTSLRLGGPAKAYVQVGDELELRRALHFADEQGLPCLLLGGGSNIVLPDQGFDGLVVHMAIRGMVFKVNGSRCRCEVGAGEVFDQFVEATLERGAAGLECLSGIPGQVGATPIQNVGAYGQEVAQTIVAVHAITRKPPYESVVFSPGDCDFGYRQSRFKNLDKHKYVITRVDFDLPLSGEPTVIYRDLVEAIDDASYDSCKTLKQKLLYVRGRVIEIRSRKSMVVDPDDEHSQSAGSFFTNPIVPEAEWKEIAAKLSAFDHVPVHVVEGGRKLSAAWLVERAGFAKGTRLASGVGISANHSLALVNYGGTTAALLALAAQIQAKVKEVFGVSLTIEPEVVPAPLR